MYRRPRSPLSDRVVFLRACDVVVEALEFRQMMSVTAPPNGPYGLVATATGPTSVEVQFIDNADDETGFEIDRRTADGQLNGTFTLGPSAGVGGTVTFTDTTASPLTSYQYVAFAKNFYISSVAGPANVTTPPAGTTPGNGGTTNPGGAPNGPYGLTAVATSPTAVKLSFTDYATNETGFAVERSTAVNGPFFRVATIPAGAGSGTTVHFTDTTADGGSSYFYRVFAVNGPYGSSINGPVAVTTPGSPTTNPGGAPNGPFGLAVTQATTSSISLAFTDYATNETGLLVERSTSQNGPFAPVATLAPSAGSGALVTYTDFGLAAGATFWYRVSAVNGTFGSSINGPVSGSTTTENSTGPGLPNPGGPPNGPYGLIVSATATAKFAERPVEISFVDNADNETGFVVERATSANGPWTQIAFRFANQGTGNRITVTDNTSFAPGQTYYVRVYAINGPYASSIAGPVAVTTAPDFLSHGFAGGAATQFDTQSAGYVRVALDAASGYFYTASPDTTTAGPTHHGPTIERWNATTGAMDQTFGGTGRVYVNDVSPVPFETVTGIAVQSTGKIIVAGNVLSQALRDLLIVRLNADGTLDATFNNGAKVQSVTVNALTDERDTVADVAVSSSDQIYVGGSYTNNTSTGADFFAARFDANGLLDATFGGDGIVSGPLTNNATATAHRIAIDTDGSAVVVGSRLANVSDNLYGERFNPNGTVTDAFSISTLIGAASARDLLIQPDHKIVVAGRLGNDAFVDRRNADGTADPTWVPMHAPANNGQGVATFDAITRLPDGTYFAAGTLESPFITGTGFRDVLVAKLQANGVPGPNFGSGGIWQTEFGGADDEALALVLPADGSPIAAGVSNGRGFFAKYKVT